MIKRSLAIAVFLGALSSSVPARAEVALGFANSGYFGVGDAAVSLPTSWSLSGLLGYRVRINRRLELTPELELSYLKAIGPTGYREIERSFQLAGGARLAINLGALVPSAHMHFGLGNVAVLTANSIKDRKTGPYVEVGGALDARLTPKILLGVQLAFGAVTVSELEHDVETSSVKWVRAGPRLTFFF